MERARAGTREGQSGGSVACSRAASLGIPALLLLLTAGCSAGTGLGGSGIGSAPTSVAPVPAPGVSGQPATAQPTSAHATLEAALRRAFDGGRPGAEHVRGAVVAAGFTTGDVEVTAGRTPTGLDADAVEVGVRHGGDCLVAQVRSGAVSVVVLPVLADGRCLVGATVP